LGVPWRGRRQRILVVIPSGVGVVKLWRSLAVSKSSQVKVVDTCVSL
jgi:hypothetical protein